MQWWTLVLGYRYWPKIQALQRPRPRNHQHRWPNPSIRRPLVSKPLANSGAETIRNRRGKDETEIHWSSWIHGKSWMTWWMTESDDIMLFLWPFWLIIMDVLMTMYTFFFTIVVDIYICSDSLYTPSGNMLHIYQELNGPRLPYQTEDSPLIHFDPL